jgi:hypothetical protein
MEDNKDMITKHIMVNENIFKALYEHIKELEGIGIQNPIENIKGMLDSIKIATQLSIDDDDDHHGDNVDF